MIDRIRGIAKQLRALFFRRSSERDLADELGFHLEMEAAANERRGMSPAEARRAALRAFGGAERYTERVREVRWTRWPEDLLADVRYAARLLARRPAFAAAVVVTLGLGIGGTTAIFSVVDGLFFRAPAGVADAAAVRTVYIVRDEGSIRTPSGGPGSWVAYAALRAGVTAFSGVAAFVGPRLVDLGRGEEAEQIRVAAVSADYFDVLGVATPLGRGFAAEEHGAPGAHPVALISHGMWQTRFGGARDVLGATLLLNGEPVEIVGVVQKEFVGLHADALDVWLPSAMAGPVGLIFVGSEDWRTQAGMAAVMYVARLARGAEEATAVAQAEAALRHAAESEPALDPTPGALLTSLVPAASPYSSTGVERVSLWLALVAGLVLVIACANVANLLLTRAVARRRELAVRLSLGAGRRRVARQQLTESLVLALLGGAAGVLVAYWGLRVFSYFPLPPAAGQLDTRLLLFALAVSLLTGLLFGVLPALRAVRFDPVPALKASRAVASLTRSRTRRALVVLQVSLSLALLVGAGLFVASLRQVHAIDSGVDVDRLLTASVDLRRVGYDRAAREAFYEHALERLVALPGVERAAIVHFEPFGGAGMSVAWRIPGRQAPAGAEGP
jgi:putative ABC transport system permease protein